MARQGDDIRARGIPLIDEYQRLLFVHRGASVAIAFQVTLIDEPTRGQFYLAVWLRIMRRLRMMSQYICGGISVDYGIFKKTARIPRYRWIG